MSIVEVFRAAWRGADAADGAVIELLPEYLTRACVQVLPVDGAGLSVFSGDVRVPLGASDDDAERAERLQFTLGQGPCLDALRTGVPTRAGFEQIRQRWTPFAIELFNGTPFRSIGSFPLLVFSGLLGALDLYARGPDQIQQVNWADVAAVSVPMTQALAAVPTGTDQWGVKNVRWLQNATAQRRGDVWIAVGMLNAAFGLPARDALAMLRARAYTCELSLDHVAADLVSKRIPLTDLVP